MSEPNECPHLIEVHRLWEGEIDARRVGEVWQHLAHCSGCRAAYEDWNRLSGLLARGDPAAPLVPERQRQMKAKLLAECAASLDAAGDAARPRSAPHTVAWGWRMPVRIAVALVPLALVVLLLYVGRRVPHSEIRPTEVASHLRVLPPREPVAAPRGPMVDPAHGTSKPPTRPHTKAFPRVVQRPRRAARSRRIEMAGAWLGQRVRLRSTFPEPRGVGMPRGHADRVRTPAIMRSLSAYAIHPPSRTTRPGRPANSPPDRLHEPASRGTVASVPANERGGVSPGSGRSALQPIKRIVIQVDGPPIHTRSVTHITVIAAGDPEAPGARLTIVKSRREEALP